MSSGDHTLANTYRPQKFADVVGQSTAVSLMKRLAGADGIAARAVFLKGAWGSGKCIAGDQRISTDAGYCRIDSLLPSASEGFTPFTIGVEQPDGSFEMTSHFYKETNVKLYRLHGLSGRVYTGTARHPLMCWSKSHADSRLTSCSLVREGDAVCRRRPITLLPADAFHGDESLMEYVSQGFIAGGGAATLNVVPTSASKGFTRDNPSYPDFVGTLFLGRDLPSFSGITLLSSAFPSRRVVMAFLLGYSIYAGGYTEDGSFCFKVADGVKATVLMDMLDYLGVTYCLVDPPTSKTSYLAIHPMLRGLLIAHLCAMGNDLRIGMLSYMSWLSGARTHVSVRWDRFKTVDDYILDPIVYIRTEKATVYDVSVPTTHLFMSQNVVNHNTTLSRIFAKALNCESFKRTGDVCGECAGCREAASPTSTTYWELDGTTVGTVDGIKALKERLSLVPSGRRLVTLDEVQAISASAASTLLKVVEEGVPNTMFLFCGTEDISAPLRSRCVNVDIELLPLGLIEDRVRSICAERGTEISPAQLRILAQKSGGHMRDALSILQLFELVGAAALDTSYSVLLEFVVSCLRKQATAGDVLQKLLMYPSVDICQSIGVLIRNIYIADDQSSMEYKLQRAGMGSSLFRFFFAPTAQAALKSEVGLELLLRDFMSRALGK